MHPTLRSRLRLFLAHSVLLGLTACAAPGAAPAPLCAPPGEIYLTRVAPDAIEIDGQLNEWQELPGAYICDAWHRLHGGPPRQFRAMVRLARDPEGVCLAVRALDAEVVNTRGVEELWGGDCVEVFFDLRPEVPSGGDYELGYPAYTDGCFQILVSPVTSEGQAEPRWWCPQVLGDQRPVGMEESPLKMQAASAMTADGYAMEMRIPFAELGAGPQRFDAPVGFDVQIEDYRRGEDGQMEGAGCWAWQGQGDNYRRPENFGRTRPVARDAAAPAVLAWMPAEEVHWDETGGFVNGVALREGAWGGEAPDLALELTFAGTALDRPPDPTQWQVEDADARPLVRDVRLRSWRDEVFGATCHERRLEVAPFVGGRYRLEAACRLGKREARAQRRLYHLESGENARFIDAGPPRGAEAVLDELAQTAWFQMSGYHVFADTELSVNAWASPHLAWPLSEAAEAGPGGHHVRLDVEPLERGEPARSVSVTLRPWGQTPTTLSTAGLPDGNYAVRATAVGPSGRDKPVWHPARPDWPGTAPTCVLGVQRGADPVRLTTTEDAEPLLSRLVPLGNPYKAEFPNDDELHSYARNIWDMQLYRGRVYVGCGDWQNNQGPITVRSFDPATAGTEAQFDDEFTVDDESVDRLIVLGERLAVPGADAIESWEWGNLYVKEAGEWRKLRTVPNGLHVFDAAIFGGRLYVTTCTERGGALFSSEDGGRTWQPHTLAGEDELMDGRYYEVVKLGDRLLVLPSRVLEFAYLFDGERLERVVAPFMPRYPGRWCAPHRAVAFRGCAAYTARWGPSSPLYVAEDVQEGARLVECFQDEAVQDVLAREDRIYVLTTRKGADGFEGEVWSSYDLDVWARLAAFDAPAPARSLELAEGTFFVGLGCPEGESNASSGVICRLE